MNNEQPSDAPAENPPDHLLLDDPAGRLKWFLEERNARMGEKPPYFTELKLEQLKIDGDNLSVVVLFTDDTEQDVEQVRQMVARLNDPSIHVFAARADHAGQTVKVCGFTTVIPYSGVGALIFGKLARIAVSSTSETIEKALVAAVFVARSMELK